VPDTFVPLALVLRKAQHDTIQAATVVEPEPEPVPPCHPELIEGRDEIDEALGDVRRFRAAVADAVDCKVADVLADIASSVLGRELLIAPADVLAIVKRAIAALDDERVIALRVHPDEADALTRQPMPVIADMNLRRGDVVLDVLSGTIDRRLGIRLQRVLDAASAR
jgi:flagellar biosynthesis/type III secretory pathway protein FliH